MWIKGIYKSLIRRFGDRLVDGIILTGFGYFESCLIYYLAIYLFMPHIIIGMFLYFFGIGLGAYFVISGLDTLLRGED